MEGEPGDACQLEPFLDTLRPRLPRLPHRLLTQTPAAWLHAARSHKFKVENANNVKFSFLFFSRILQAVRLCESGYTWTNVGRTMKPTDHHSMF